MSELVKTKRNANFDLMGIILMLMIISEHILLYSGKLSNIGTIEYYISNLYKSFCVIAVNAFVLRSGYFGIKRKWDKIAKIDIRTCFYTYVFFILGVVLKIHSIDVITDVKLLFPVITGQYWYITSYIALCIFAPYLNILLDKLSKKQLKSFLIFGFVVFYLVATFCFTINANQLVPDAGYGIVNFVYLYCLGYYIRNYCEEKRSKYVYIVGIVISCLMLFASNMLLSKVLGFYFDSYFSYNTVFVLAGSIFLFMFFKNINIKESKILYKLSNRTLVVYIVHMNPVVSKYFFNELLRVADLNGFNLVLCVLCLPIISFIVISILDHIVDYVLKPLELSLIKGVSKLYKKY